MPADGFLKTVKLLRARFVNHLERLARRYDTTLGDSNFLNRSVTIISPSLSDCVYNIHSLEDLRPQEEMYIC